MLGRLELLARTLDDVGVGTVTVLNRCIADMKFESAQTNIARQLNLPSKKSNEDGNEEDGTDGDDKCDGGDV